MRSVEPHPWPSRPALAALGLACWVAFAIVLVVAVRTRPGQRLDELLFGVVLNTIPPDVRLALDGFARRWAIVVLAPLTAVLAVTALLRRRRRGAVLALLLPVVLAPVTLWMRDAGVVRPALGVGGYAHNTFPSVHAAAVFSLLAGILAVWPARLKRWHLAVLGGTAALAGLGNVAWYAHRPADVAGSLLLVAGATLCGWAVLDPRPAPRTVSRDPRAPTHVPD